MIYEATPGSLERIQWPREAPGLRTQRLVGPHPTAVQAGGRGEAQEKHHSQDTVQEPRGTGLSTRQEQGWATALPKGRQLVTILHGEREVQ